MRNLWLFFIIGVVSLGCSHFEVSNTIKPEVTIIGKEIGLVYKLGDITIADTIKPNKKKRQWLEANKDKAQWTLYVRFEGENHSAPYFYYYVNGILFVPAHQIPGVTEYLLIANMDSIPGFHLYKINGNKVSEKDDEIIEKEISKVKKEVEEHPDKYKPIDRKW